MIPNTMMSLFDSRVEEGKVYIISSPSVRFNFGTVMPTYHRYKFVFNKETKVVPSENSSIPIHGFSLIGADGVLSKRKCFRYLVGKYRLICYSVCLLLCMSVC
jgi:hypothetical protein